MEVVVFELEFDPELDPDPKPELEPVEPDDDHVDVPDAVVESSLVDVPVAFLPVVTAVHTPSSVVLATYPIPSAEVELVSEKYGAQMVFEGGGSLLARYGGLLATNTRPIDTVPRQDSGGVRSVGRRKRDGKARSVGVRIDFRGRVAYQYCWGRGGVSDGPDEERGWGTAVGEEGIVVYCLGACGSGGVHGRGVEGGCGGLHSGELADSNLFVFYHLYGTG